MIKILAFGGSNSKNSINKQLAEYASSLFDDALVNLIDLNDYPLPIYGVDTEINDGIPKSAFAFAELIDNSDLLVISLAEHNGAYSVAFKNVFDWISRIPNRKVFNDKKIFLLATSPGARGGGSVLEIAKNRFPYNGGEIVGTFSLPNFGENFKDGKIINLELNQQLVETIESIKSKL
ncbi:MAG: NAD(P)H-dependent oxidoreductase [Flavobacteriales bacterium]|nr:NAD(P)H-dependent oxidoreductase [Flavobacteriales bacterium]